MKYLVFFKNGTHCIVTKKSMWTYIERSKNYAVINFMLKNILSTIELFLHDPPYHGSLFYQGAPIIFWVWDQSRWHFSDVKVRARQASLSLFAAPCLHSELGIIFFFSSPSSSLSDSIVFGPMHMHKSFGIPFQCWHLAAGQIHLIILALMSLPWP